MAQNLILIDSSIWIQCFKPGNSKYTEHLSRLLSDDRVAICGPVRAEVLSGARSLEDFRKFSNWFEGLPYLSVSDEKVWERIAESRFKLARKGIQQNLVDLLIAWIAYEHDVPVWSLDTDFEGIIEVVSFKIYHP
ncbi:MAG: PIN domain-containing protein [Candidatus Omnitrophota bacterium]